MLRFFVTWSRWLNFTTPNFASAPRMRTSGGLRPSGGELADLNVVETTRADKNRHANAVMGFMFASWTSRPRGVRLAFMTEQARQAWVIAELLKVRVAGTIGHR